MPVPVRVTHVLEEAAGEDSVRLLSLLLKLMPRDRVEQRLIVIGRPPPALDAASVSTIRLGRRFEWPLLWAVDLQRALRQHASDVVLAWSAPAAAASTIVSSRSVIATLTDPAEANQCGRWWRTLGRGENSLQLVCASARVQRRLIEAGVPLADTAIVRPGVDFGAIRQAKAAVTRASLGLPAHARVFVTPSPPSRAGGQFYAMWAMAVLHQIWPDARMIIPGVSREQARLRRLVERLYCPEAFLFVGGTFTPAELLGVGDMLVASAIDDVPTGWLTWAMAAGVPIVGSAVPAVAELIADRHNGFLCRAAEPHTLAIRIRTAAESPDMLRQCADTARGQAYDIFRAQRCVDEYLKIIENAAQGRPALTGVQDAARVS